MDTASRTSFRLGPYTCVEKLGSGPIGDTFRAKIYGLGGAERHFALKRLHPRLAEDERFVARLGALVKLQAQLTHASLGCSSELQDDGLQRWLVADYIHGMDLRRFLDALVARRERLPPDVAALLVAEIATAVAYAHGRTDLLSEGVVHGAVTPGSILVTPDGGVRLSNVALLRALPDAAWMQRPEGLGYLPYFAPEVLQGEPPQRASDVWSLGAVLWELVAAGPPFPGRTPDELLAACERGPVGTTRDPTLGQLAQRCLQLTPASRIGSAAELGSALVEHLGVRAAQARSTMTALARRVIPRRTSTQSMAAANATPLPKNEGGPARRDSDAGKGPATRSWMPPPSRDPFRKPTPVPGEELAPAEAELGGAPTGEFSAEGAAPDFAAVADAQAAAPEPAPDGDFGEVPAPSSEWGARGGSNGHAPAPADFAPPPSDAEAAPSTTEFGAADELSPARSARADESELSFADLGAEPGSAGSPARGGSPVDEFAAPAGPAASELAEAAAPPATIPEQDNEFGAAITEQVKAVMAAPEPPAASRPAFDNDDFSAPAPSAPAPQEVAPPPPEPSSARSDELGSPAEPEAAPPSVRSPPVAQDVDFGPAETAPPAELDDDMGLPPELDGELLDDRFALPAPVPAAATPPRAGTGRETRVDENDEAHTPPRGLPKVQAPVAAGAAAPPPEEDAVFELSWEDDEVSTSPGLSTLKASAVSDLATTLKTSQVPGGDFLPSAVDGNEPRGDGEQETDEAIDDLVEVDPSLRSLVSAARSADVEMPLLAAPTHLPGLGPTSLSALSAALARSSVEAPPESQPGVRLRKNTGLHELSKSLQVPPTTDPKRIAKAVTAICLVVTIAAGIALAWEPAVNGLAALRVAPRVERTAPPRAPAMVTAPLQINSQPPGANVYVDGEPRGLTPSDLTVPPGQHQVVLLADGKAVWASGVEVPVAGTIVPATLKKLHLTTKPSHNASLQIRCTTVGELRLFLDGVDTGTNCPNRAPLPVTAGDHKIGLFSPRTGKTITLERAAKAGPYPTVVIVSY